MRQQVNAQRKLKSSFAAHVVQWVFNVIMVNVLVWIPFAMAMPSVRTFPMKRWNIVRPHIVRRMHFVVATALALAVKRNVIYESIAPMQVMKTICCAAVEKINKSKWYRMYGQCHKDLSNNTNHHHQRMDRRQHQAHRYRIITIIMRNKHRPHRHYNLVEPILFQRTETRTTNMTPIKRWNTAKLWKISLASIINALRTIIWSGMARISVSMGIGNRQNRNVDPGVVHKKFKVLPYPQIVSPSWIMCKNQRHAFDR